MSAHTPGPWEVSPYESDRFPECSAITADDHCVCVASSVAKRANAHVIAAAPDLLAVVEEAIRLYGRPGGPWNVPSDPGGWMDRAQEAVALARGGER